MRRKEQLIFFSILGEIWRDITAVEFLMRCAIAKKVGEESKFPQPPYKKGHVYKEYPAVFGHLSFEIIVNKFARRFPQIIIPKDLVQLRDALAHGITAEFDKSGTIQLVKFKELKDKKELKVEYSLNLQIDKICLIRQELRTFRRSIGANLNEASL